MKYRIAWKYKSSSETGGGEASTNQSALRAWVSWANKNFPRLWHWVEEVPES